MNKLKYSNYDIVFQEVPGETSLALNITNCPHKCEGCHSSFLSEDFGNYVDNDIDMLIDKYRGLITCVCFMGGDQAYENLKENLVKVKNKGLKTCVYSGVKDLGFFEDSFENIDYLKVGPYVKELGGLSKKTTNQRMYKITNSNNSLEIKCINSYFVKD